MTQLLGYARVSTTDQAPGLQLDALREAGCARVWTEQATGTRADRPQLTALLAHMREGDTLVVWRLDRLARSLKDLIELVGRLESAGVGLRSLREQIDTTSPGGRLVLHVFGALAEFEADLIGERTHAGLAAARARGRKGGRRTVMTAAKLRAAAQMREAGEMSIEEIACALGVGRATLYRAWAATEAPPAAHAIAAPAKPPVAPTSPAATPNRKAAAVTKPSAVMISGSEPKLSSRMEQQLRSYALPSEAAALGRACPLCGAAAGVSCRKTSSRAKRKPAAGFTHLARWWLDRTCPSCHQPPGEPCRTPNGRTAADIHAPRKRPTPPEHEARRRARQTASRE